MITPNKPIPKSLKYVFILLSGGVYVCKLLKLSSSAGELLIFKNKFVFVKLLDWLTTLFCCELLVFCTF